MTGVTPAQGSTFGGTEVTISGERFTADLGVTIGGAPASQVTLLDEHTLHATTPAHAEGPADVSVKGATGSSTLPGGFTYVAPTVENAPPAINAIAVKGNRAGEPASYANIDERVSVTASVSDPETPISSLRFEWSASAGAIAGDGPSVAFTAPHTAGKVTIRLTVVETYTAPGPGGLPESRENRVAADTVVSVHDEVGEVGGMAKTFLDRFTDSNVSADTVTQDFKRDECYPNVHDAADERAQVKNNRANYTIISPSSVGSPRVTVRFGGSSPYNFKPGDAYAALDVSWTSRCLTTADPACPSVGFVGTVSGTDWVTSHYDPPTDRWWLCDSSFESKSSTFPAATLFIR